MLPQYHQGPDSKITFQPCEIIMNLFISIFSTLFLSLLLQPSISTDLQCENGFIWDSKSKICVAPVGFPCSDTMDCISNAICDPDGKCQCKEHFINRNSSCIYAATGLPHGAKCDPIQIPDDCDSTKGLQCSPSTEKCECENPENSFYDENTRSCYLESGAVCDLASPVNCHPNSECIYQTPRTVWDERSNENNRHCLCNEGLVENLEKKCFLPYFSPCKSDHDLCDPNSFLACSKTGHCDCQDPDNQWFDPTTKKCVNLVGTQCNSPQSGPECVPNADCVISNDGSGVCECERGRNLAPNEQGFCVIFHGGYCEPNSDYCDKSRNLECGSKSKCVCQTEEDKDNFAIYDDNTETCFKTVGSKNCRNESFRCVPNAECDHTDTCQCIEGLQKNNAGLCFLLYGNLCDSGNDLCDPHAFLVCNRDDSTCSCKDPQNTWFNANTLRCNRKAGSSCFPESIVVNYQPCVPNADCVVDTSGSYICECRSSFTKNEDGQCFLRHGERCDLPGMRNLCNPSEFLECGESGRCQCHGTHTYYDAESTSCKVMASGSCGLEHPDCTQNAICNVNGVCTCLPNFSPDDSRMCVPNPTYGSSCFLDNYCGDSDNNLECIRGMCDCKWGYFTSKQYNRTTCLPGFKLPCSIAIPCSPESNTRCRSGICQCLASYEEPTNQDLNACIAVSGGTRLGYTGQFALILFTAWFMIP